MPKLSERVMELEIASKHLDQRIDNLVDLLDKGGPIFCGFNELVGRVQELEKEVAALKKKSR